MGLLDILFNRNSKKETEDQPSESEAEAQTEAPQESPREPEEAAAPSQETDADAPPEAAADTSQTSLDPRAIEEGIVAAVKTVFDPEIPVNIHDLGLIYEVSVDESGMAYVKMTLTAPNCPAAGILPGQVESSARSVPGVKGVKLDLVFDPPWSPDRMSEAARLELGML